MHKVQSVVVRLVFSRFIPFGDDGTDLRPVDPQSPQPGFQSVLLFNIDPTSELVNLPPITLRLISNDTPNVRAGGESLVKNIVCAEDQSLRFGGKSYSFIGETLDRFQFEVCNVHIHHVRAFFSGFVDIQVPFADE